jgi:aquaporin Z
MIGDYVQRIFAEFVGTFALVLIAAGTVIYGDLVASALAYGLVVAVMVMSLAHVSGGHFNPAVTLAVFITRRIATPLALTYVIVQFGAAALAALFLEWILPSLQQVNDLHLGAPTLNATLSVDTGKGVAVEAALTFFVVWTVFAVFADARNTFKHVAGLAVGLAIAFGALFGTFLTGAAMNPARAFGPELVGNYWTDWWVWYVGPFAGAILAAVFFELFYLRQGQGTEATEARGEEAEEPVPAADEAPEEPPPGTAAAG